jgi:hypothetical protein
MYRTLIQMTAQKKQVSQDKSLMKRKAVALKVVMELKKWLMIWIKTTRTKENKTCK